MQPADIIANVITVTADLHANPTFHIPHGPRIGKDAGHPFERVGFRLVPRRGRLPPNFPSQSPGTTTPRLEGAYHRNAQGKTKLHWDLNAHLVW